MQATTVNPVRPQRPAAVTRTASGPDTRIHDWALASGRMLVATFFIASAVANMGNSAFDFSAIAHAESSLLFNAIIYSMAFAVLVGRYMHIAALALALIMLWSSTLQLTNGEQTLANYWQDLAIIGALFYMAASRGASVMPSLARVVSRSRAVTPRRVISEARLGADSAAGPQPQMSRNHVARPVPMPMFVSRRAR